MRIDITKDQSEGIKVLRVIAVISIVMAHIPLDNAPLLCQFTYARIACTGVPLFLCMSGFLFRVKPEETFWNFLTRKLVSVILPWFFCASVVFFWLQFRRGSAFDFAVYLKFILGYGSIYYYVPVLMVIMAVFFAFRSDQTCYLLIFVNVISLLCTASGLVERIGLSSFNYLNIFNWCGFFAFGILVRRGRIALLIDDKKMWLFTAMISLALSIALDYVIGAESGYFSWFSLCSELSCITIALWLSKSKFLRNRIFFYIASSSYCIYLLHQPLVGFFIKRLRANIIALSLIPLLVIALMTGLLYLFDRILITTHQTRLSKIVFALIGIRR